MLKTYHAKKEGIEETVKIEPISWINVVEPNPEELDILVNDLKINESFIKYSLDEEEISRIMTENNQTLILVDVPIFDNEKHPLFYTLPLGVILKDKKIVTICSKEYKGLRDFINNIIKLDITDTMEAVLEMIDRIILSYLNNLRTINKQAERLELNLQKSTKNKELLKLMAVQKSLVYFRTSLSSNNKLLERLNKEEALVKEENDKKHLENILIEIKQAIETASIYSEILNGMMDAFASVINNNLNIIMKFLAGITIIFSIPTMIASFMGMNIPLGIFSSSPYALIYILILSFGLAAIVAYILKKKNLL